ncbi:MAG: DEAD/DEAH box helicase [Bryobacteraceae bacterium]|nr:DEAD/DEAH box helicase [Bryobacteraceae bacterium]
MRSPFGLYAFEVDGEFWHDPHSPRVTPAEFRGSLTRQNSLVYQGWKVYRWTDQQLLIEHSRVVEQLRLFLEREIAAGTLGDLLPLQDAGEFSLREHQSEALGALEAMRAEGKTIALLTHATGTGKTHVAVTDARRTGLKTLYLAHREKLPRQTEERFRDLWPQATTALFRSGAGKPNAHVVLSTFQAMSRNLSRFDPREFGYLIVDEAHHAVAETFREVIAFFQPRFTLGLTATPERSDERPLLQIFRETAHRLELEDAIRRDILVPIRCVRVETNVDLRHIRYNSVDYRARDLEEAIQVPGRDELVVNIYARHASRKRGVCFCVNVLHAERMASEFKNAGVAAASVSGRMPLNQREEVLRAYQAGEIAVLCACDILNEGWDSPCAEVLLMTRPTLSKIVYVQQLGRGTRKAPGKEHLLVFDFVDQSTRYAQALSLHRLFKKTEYRAGALVAAPEEQLLQEQQIIKAGEIPPVILGIGIYDTALRPVDVFRWQDEAEGMIAANELAIELRVDDSTIRDRIRRGEISPDLNVPVGDREYHFFRRDRVAELQRQYGVTPLSDENIRDLFLKFVDDADMSASYKPVLLLGMLRCADASGRVRVSDLVSFFRDFYLERKKQGLLPEAPLRRMARVAELTDLDIERTMLTMPFEKFERKRFFRRLKDLAVVRFTETLWRRLTEADREYLAAKAQEQITGYYSRLEVAQ